MRTPILRSCNNQGFSILMGVFLAPVCCPPIITVPFISNSLIGTSTVCAALLFNTERFCLADSATGKCCHWQVAGLPWCCDTYFWGRHFALLILWFPPPYKSCLPKSSSHPPCHGPGFISLGPQVESPSQRIIPT